MTRNKNAREMYGTKTKDGDKGLSENVYRLKVLTNTVPKI